GSFDRPSTKVATSKAKRRSGELHIPTKAPEFKQASCLVSMRSQSSRVPTRAPWSNRASRRARTTWTTW
ncbi:hypothetical protein V3C99_006489, partial [Haemonchus contortus]